VAYYQVDQVEAPSESRAGIALDLDGVQGFSVGILRVLQEPHQRHRRRGDLKPS
jgi:hypothetical protein